MQDEYLHSFLGPDINSCGEPPPEAFRPGLKRGEKIAAIERKRGEKIAAIARKRGEKIAAIARAAIGNALGRGAARV